MGQNESQPSQTPLADRAAMNGARKISTVSNTAPPSSSSSSSSTTAQQGSGRSVFLNIYEPSGKGGQQAPGQVPGFGVYHSGIEIAGTEWTFAGGGSGSGVCQQTPKVTPIGTDWKFKQSLNLGSPTLSDAQMLGVLRQMEVEWTASSYHIVHRNCNHFTEAVATKLGLEFPSWVNRAANLGKHFISKPSSVTDPVVEPPKPSVFATSKGHRLDDSAAPPPASKFSALFKKKEESAPPKEKKNPWADPNFKLAQQAKTTSTPSAS